MSHTDKTRPYRVRIWDRTDLTAVEYHDHCDGVCTLPATLDEDRNLPWSRGHCRLEFTYTGTNICSCQWCSGRGRWARWERRATRHRVQQQLRTVDPTDLDRWDDLTWPRR